MQKALFLLAMFSALIMNAQNSQPNIVFILLDDMGWSDFGCYGSEIPTPNIDSLAYNGIRCTNFYNGAVCVPTRSMLLSGQYPQQNGFDSINANGFFQNAVTLGEVLKEADYNTMISGKHHSSENLFYRGFDRAYGLLDGAMNYFNPGLQRVGEPVPAQKNVRKWVDNDLQFYTNDPSYQYYFPENFYATVAFTDKALSFLQEFENEDDPFFLYLSYNAPHDPLHAPDSLIALFDGFYDDGYHTVRDARYQKQVLEGLFDENVYPLSIAGDMPNWTNYTAADKEIEALKMEVYAAMIKMVDIQIGRLIQYLDSTGERDNTIIFIASDNGASAATNDFGYGQIGDLERFSSTGVGWSIVSNTPFKKWKLTNREGGINSPLIINWPDGISDPGRIINNRMHFNDIMPTLINLTNAKYNLTHDNEYVNPMQGFDFSNILFNEPLSTRKRPMFFKFNDKDAIIDENNYKAIKNDSWELYNLNTDATETINIASQEPLVLQDLTDQFDEWYESVLQKPPVALADTVKALKKNFSIIDVFSNDFDPDGTIDISKTEIVKEPEDGQILFSQTEQKLVYESFGSAVEKDSFEYVIYDDKNAFSHHTKVILNLCTKADSCNIVLANDDDLIFNDHFQVFPVPAEQFVYLMLKENFEANKLSILNLNGQKVNIKSIDLLNNRRIKLDISNFKRGTYFIKYRSAIRKITKL